jgi:hypothetical protein
MGRAGIFALIFCALAVSCATADVPVDDDSGTGNPPVDAGACTSMCSGMCADLKTDTANCGKCGNACPAMATCVQGSCQCPAGSTRCGNACVDTKTDNANCGKCGSICGGADAGPIMGGGTYGCVMGTCGIMCPSPKIECTGACVDVKTDNDNCGMCGNPCMAMTEQCMAGMCCKTGNTICNNMCTDTSGDPKNCGMCGNVCPMNMPACTGGKCSTAILVDIFPPSGTLQDPGNASVWGARYYTVAFNQQRTITAIEWLANLSSNDTIRAEIWDPSNSTKVATGNAVTGNNMKAYQRSTINFTAQANTKYLVGVFMSNANTVFPRKDSPSFPYTVSGITVSACWSTSTSNTDIFPTSTNVWGPDFRLEIQ